MSMSVLYFCFNISFQEMTQKNVKKEEKKKLETPSHVHSLLTCRGCMVESSFSQFTFPNLSRYTVVNSIVSLECRLEYRMTRRLHLQLLYALSKIALEIHSKWLKIENFAFAKNEILFGAFGKSHHCQCKSFDLAFVG